MKSDNDKKYEKVHVTFKLSAEANKLLSESSRRSSRSKLKEVELRVEDHLMRFHGISEKGKTVNNDQITRKSKFVEC